MGNDLRPSGPDPDEPSRGTRSGDEPTAPGAHSHLERLGDYRILRELGRGGMGVVYEAERESLKVRVALKVMHPTFRTDATHLRRFHGEARSAARLHHTNIVPVFDFGEQDGICYYAMQMISGVGLNQVLDEVRRLRRPVEAAPVSTRDGNRSGDPAARAVAWPGPLSIVSEALLTGGFATGPAVGSGSEPTATLPIDRPERGGPVIPAPSATARSEAGGGLSHGGSVTGGGSISGRSDSTYHREVARICSQVADALDYAHRQGVIHRDIKPSNLLLDEQGTVWVTDFGLAKVVEEDDLSHSHELVGTLRFMAPERFEGVTDRRSDLYALGATLYELLTLRPAFDERDPARLMRQIAEQPVVPPRQHDRRISRDMETLVLKALARDPKDRFATAGELRDELRRALEGRPIRSRPVGTGERIWRWCKRNPVVASLLGLVIGLTVALAVGSTAAWLRLRTSYEEVRLERNRAEENFREARRAVDDSFTRVSESALLDAPGMQPLRKQLLGDALGYYQGFLRRLGDRPGVQAELAAALDRVSRITSEIGSKEEALAYELKALGIYGTLADARPDDVRIRRDLARSIATVASLRGEAGRREEAESDYRRALAIQRSLAAFDPGDAQVQDDLAASEAGLADVLRYLVRKEEALQCHERALAIRERLADAFPDVPRRRRDLAAALSHVGLLHRDAGRHEEAIGFFRRAIAIQEAVVAGQREVASSRHILANSCNLLGVSLRNLDRLGEAMESYRKARTTLEALVAANPSVSDYRYDLAGILNNMANIQRAQGHREEALGTHRQALGIFEALVAANPRVVRYQSSMAGSYNAIAMLQGRMGRLHDALATFGRFRERMLAVVADDPKNLDARHWISSASHNMGGALMDLDRPAEAIPFYREAIEQKRLILGELPTARNVVRALGDDYLELAAARRALGRAAEAAATLLDHQELWAGDPDGLYNLACGLSLCIPAVGAGAGSAGPAPGRRAERREYADLAMDALLRAAKAGYRDASHMSQDADLRPLRERHDFRALLGDLGFPSQPFATAR